jgi:hypothetical protein
MLRILYSAKIENWMRKAKPLGTARGFKKAEGMN